MIPKKSRGPNARFPNFAVLATITNNRRRESASHKAKKSTEKSSGAASEPPRPLPLLRLPIPNFFFSPKASSPAPRDDDPEASRSFQGLTPRAAPPQIATSGSGEAASRGRRRGGGGAGRRGRRRRGKARLGFGVGVGLRRPAPR
ncbi:hypothetical protein PVAP13_9NG499114 [Panicum virgatum]|uniref:Uncharacterized protein n=1 Tax=Panicum virgatum TaxID=38727 RepID=A0A8T0MQU9_PANVG|nr:hypothetical protein PVAP13_9NG499114 [Panicum virgatum]